MRLISHEKHVAKDVANRVFFRQKRGKTGGNRQNRSGMHPVLREETDYPLVWGTFKQRKGREAMLTMFPVCTRVGYLSISLSLTIDMPLVTALAPPTRAPMKGVATKPSETLSPARERATERVGAQVQHSTRDFSPGSLCCCYCCVCAVEMAHAQNKKEQRGLKAI